MLKITKNCDNIMLAVVAGCVDLQSLKTEEVVNMSTYEIIIVILTVIEIMLWIIEIIKK